ncbi:hypothetical protein [Nocardioides antri]|uniref:Uncharacterized protein n=1 Tax=Nocardioides antri TaxID=2607659 RepID=A0A5B1M3P6_9ACTN|nr:hypothetical protein [Nocardioides antri]KAA1427266.1 hypothetical protein F0U47_07145 [Nocardioides antri]
MMRRVLAAATVVVVLAGCDGSAEPDTEPSDAVVTSSPTSEAVDPGPVVECPRAVAEPDPQLPDEVPDGATSVRLCDGGADEVTPPLDALTTDVASVASAINDQPLVSRACADRQLPTYQLAFGYPDGSRFVVAGRFTRCGELLVGSGRRAKAGPPLRTFLDLLQAQRSTTTPPDRMFGPDSLDCAQPQQEWTWPLGDPAELTVAVLCVGQPDRPGEARRATIPPDDLATLVASMERHTASTADVFTCPVPRTEHWIVGANAWGDPITLPHGCLGPTIRPGRDWRPRGEAREIVRKLVKNAG